LAQENLFGASCETATLHFLKRAPQQLLMIGATIDISKGLSVCKL
jgi:hypothetical protein